MPTNYTNVPTSRQGVSSGTFPPESVPLIESFWNSRKALPKIEELAHQIAASPHGQTNPVHVKKSRVTGAPVLFAGNRRRAAVLYINENIETFKALYSHISGPLGLKYLDFTGAGLSDDDMIAHNLSENIDREPLLPIDQATTVLSLRQRGWEDEKIAETLRVQVSSLDRIVSWLELPEEDQAALQEGTITRQLASELVKLPPEVAKEKSEEVKKGKKKASAAVKEIKKEKKRKKSEENGKPIALDYDDIIDQLIAEAEEHDLAFDLLNVIQGESAGPDGKPQSLADVIEFYSRPRYQTEGGSK